METEITRSRDENPQGKGKSKIVPSLRIVAWEVTRRCNLACIHCRAAAEDRVYENELKKEEIFNIIDQIAEFAKPIIILTGGEPLLRSDIFDISSYGSKKGFRMTMAPNGTLITLESARRMADSGIQRVSISLDGASAESHDRFRGVKGAFEAALRGIRCLREIGLDFQVNTTISKQNLYELPAIQELAVSLGAVAHHVFLLVPTGRGRNLTDPVDAKQYENVLNWFYEQRDKVPLQLKATCAPHYYRIMRQRAIKEGKRIDVKSFGLDAVTRGCLGGISFCFISHVGQVQPCGYLELECGNVRRQSFLEIWEKSIIFNNLRDFRKYQGKCGRCEFIRVCGGCRARAYNTTGNYLAEEPLCLYEPRASHPVS